MKKKPKKLTYGRVTVAESPKGIRVRWREDNKDRERTSPTFEDGCRLAQEINARLESGGVGSPEGSFAALVAAATARSEYANYSDDAWHNIRSIVKYHIVPAFEHRKARSVTKEELQDHLRNLLLTEQLSKHTVNRVRSILVRTGTFGIQHSIWTPAKNPAFGLRVPLSKPGEENDVQLQNIPKHRIPTEAQVVRLLDVAWEANPTHGFIFEMAARTGLRWSEIMGLRRGDFNFEHGTVSIERVRRVRRDGTVYVKPPKTTAGRRLAVVVDSSIERVKEFVESQPADDFLVRTRNNTIILRTNFQRNLNTYRRLAEFPDDLSVHSLRHFFGSNAVQAGVARTDISKIMGHSNESVTSRLYLHGDSESVTRARKLL